GLACRSTVSITGARTRSRLIRGARTAASVSPRSWCSRARFRRIWCALRGRISPDDLDGLCPDWREREAFLSGPPEMLEAVTEYWKQQLGDCDHLHVEHFQPYLGGEEGEQ